MFIASLLDNRQNISLLYVRKINLPLQQTNEEINFLEVSFRGIIMSKFA